MSAATPALCAAHAAAFACESHPSFCVVCALKAELLDSLHEMGGSAILGTPTLEPWDIRAAAELVVERAVRDEDCDDGRARFYLTADGARRVHPR